MSVVVEIKPNSTVPIGQGKGSTTTRIHEVLYSDGVTRFRCADCEKEFDRWESTFAHIGSHTKRTVKVSRKDTDSRNKKIDRIIEMVEGLRGDVPAGDKVAELTAALDAERKLRRKAESDLKKIRALLNPTD